MALDLSIHTTFLPHDDADKALGFYRDLLGWQGTPGPAEFGGYAVCELNGAAVAGIGPAMAAEGMPEPPTVWTSYLASTDAPATQDAIVAAGGTLLAPVTDVGTLGRMLIAADPQRHRMVEAERPGIVHALVAGTEAAGGDVVAFLDDDAVPRASWLAELRQGFVDPTVGGVGGPIADHVDGQVRHGGRAVGISGKDAGLVLAQKVGHGREPDKLQGIERHVDLGFVGEPIAVDRTILDTLIAADIIPVIAPIGIGADGHTYNINADTMAGAIAAAMGAARFFLLTDVVGVLDKQGELLTDLDPAKIAELRADGTITGGMIPKLEACVRAVEAGVPQAHVVDGRQPHSLLLEVFTSEGIGTMVVPDEGAGRG